MPYDHSAVKIELHRSFGSLLDLLLDTAAHSDISTREAEIRTWQLAVSIGRSVLTAVLACLCMRATHCAVAELGLTMDEVRLRMDTDYIAKLNSTFGRLRFPWFAFRDATGRTHTPARKLFPHHPKVRSSELLLEWECALAADHPFREAAEALLFFSHGAADVEDTTIEAHAVLVGGAIPTDWLYRTPTAIRECLVERATCDSKTGRPIIYASTDAHALRRFVDETWNPKWKMTNGIRLWCVDRRTGKIIHLGGEYTWGDCMDVRHRFERLQSSGHLPIDGDFGEGVVAQIALLTDGLGWIADYVLPLFPTAVLVLDPYHVIGQVADAASTLFPGKKGKSRVKRIVAAARKAIGMRRRRARTKYRNGPNKQRYKRVKSSLQGSGEDLLNDVLLPLRETTTHAKKRLDTLIKYVQRNLHRLHYGELRGRGFQIGSGAMESLHRTGSQVRLKRAGCRWTEQASQAILNLRMLVLSGRWEEYWSQSTVPHLHALRRAA